MKTGIYTITCLINNKIYVGSVCGKTSNFVKRKYRHFFDLKRNVHNNKHLQQSYNKYGEENFVFEILEECEPEFCISFEQYWVNMLGTKNPDIGYNIKDPTSGNSGKKFTEEHIRKIATANKGRKWTEEEREKRKNIIRPKCSEIARFNMKEAQKKIHLNNSSLGKIRGKLLSKFYEKNPEARNKMADKMKILSQKYRIAKLDYNTLEILEIFESMEQVIFLNETYSKGPIYSCCRGTKKSYKKFKWHYVDMKTNELII